MADPTSVPRYTVTMDTTQTPPAPVHYQREAHYAVLQPWGAEQDVMRMEDITADDFAAVFSNANVTLSGQVQTLSAQVAGLINDKATLTADRDAQKLRADKAEAELQTLRNEHDALLAAIEPVTP